MTALSVRDATPDDIPAIQAIYAHHVAHGTGTFEEVAPDQAEMRARYQTVRDVGLPYLVAVRDGAVVGYAYAGQYHRRSAYRFTLEDSIYVDAAAQRGGIGRALLSALLERCEAGPWWQMMAVVGDSQNAGSIGLHQSLGFEMVGTMRDVGLKFGAWRNVVILQRALKTPGTPVP